MRSFLWEGTDTDCIHVTCFGGVRDYSAVEHRHDGFHELTYVRHGELQHSINGTHFAQGSGWVSLLRAGRDRHALSGHGVEYVNVSCDARLLRAMGAFPEARAWRTQPEPLAVCLNTAQRVGFEAALDDLALRCNGPGAGLRLLAIVAQTLLLCVDARADARSVAAGPAWLPRVHELLTDLQRPVPDLAGLRRMAAVSDAHLARACRRHLGLSPSQYLNRCRVARAERLLAGGGLGLAAIAERVGFSDADYFRRCFTAAHGLSPAAWRQRQQRFVLIGNI